MLVLPTFYGAMLYHALEKAGAPKYIKRYRGKPDPRTGKPRWVYVYHVAHQGGIHAQDHMVPGASFKLRDAHYHIDSRDGDKLTIRNGRTGITQTMTTGDLADSLRSFHSEALGKHKNKALRDLRVAKENGVTGKALESIEKRVNMHKPDIQRIKDLQGKVRDLLNRSESKRRRDRPSKQEVVEAAGQLQRAVREVSPRAYYIIETAIREMYEAEDDREETNAMLDIWGALTAIDV